MTDKRDCVQGKRLCSPRIRPFPSGRHLAHGEDCPVRPGEKISVAEYAKGRTWPHVGQDGTR